MTTTPSPLLHNLVLFGRILRGLDFDIHPGRMVDLTQALEGIDLSRKADFYYTLRGLLVHRQEEMALFDRAFDLFWRRPAGEELLDLGNLLRRPRPSPTLPPQPTQPLAPPAGTETGPTVEQTVLEISRAYSARELLRHKDFGQLTGDELAAVRQMLAHFVWHLGERRTRRLISRPGAHPDLRRSLRRNLRYGGEWVAWLTRTPQIKPRPLVIVADMSGSMERYTRLLLHFVYSLAGGLSQRVEVFLFSTRLTHVTRQLQRRDVDEAIAQVSRAVPDWAGGTRIGEAIKRFNFSWGRRVLRGGAVVLIISDGWDRGDPALLGREMARLRRTCHRVVWLNPLLGSARYEPLTRGLQAALPFIDDFLPVHNLASLEDLAQHLRTLDDTDGVRRRLAGAAFVGGRRPTHRAPAISRPLR